MITHFTWKFWRLGERTLYLSSLWVEASSIYEFTLTFVPFLVTTGLLSHI